MQIIYPILFLLLSLKFAKWKNFKTYYPTVLFIIIGNLLYGFLFREYPLWRFEHTFEENLLPTKLSIDLLKTFLSFPILTLIFLSHFPEDKNVWKKGIYILVWTILFGGIELVSELLGMISYHNGWNMWWSIVFDLAMFTILGIHYKRPILAWALSGAFILFLWNIFNITFEKIT